MSKKTERFEVLFENNPHPTWVYDVETLFFLEVNRAAVTHYGYSREEFLAMRITDIRPPEDVGALMEEMKRERPVVRSSERRHQCKDGRVIPVNVTSHLAELNGRKVAVVVSEDITQRRQAQEVLIRAKEEAERATRFKDQFLSTMSHELRTPLNAVLGFSELLTDERYGTMNERQRRYVYHIHSGGRHLLRLINDILDLSKIEAGRLELCLETVRVNQVLGEVSSAVGPLAARKSQTLASVADDNLFVRADSTRFKQILLNLVGNAIKFTPDGGKIDLAAFTQGSQARIEVRDSGPGIPPEERERIFDAFYRLQSSADAIEGTGLGLAITQRLVQLHGAQLGLQSESGQGSCFYFSLPVAEGIVSRPAAARDLVRRGKRPPRVLVIEDDPASAQLIHSHLSSHGYEAVLCRQPQRALEMAVKLRPDAITLDLLMKPIFGWDVLVELKHDHRTTGIPVVVVTIVDQPAMGAILGADEYLVKPVEKEMLISAVDRCIRSRGGKEPTRHILVVEDDQLTREVVKELLEGKGYSVHTAQDGAQALAEVQAAMPGLVILDLLLPKLTGFEVLSEWRSDERTVDLPVFVITSKDLTRDESQFLRANSEFLLLKQFGWHNTLIRQLHRALPRHYLEAS